MVNVYKITIGQDDCPHTFISSRFPGLIIFVMNTSDESGGYQRTFSIFVSRDAIDLKGALTLLKQYPGIKGISILGMKENVMSLTYSFPKTSAYRSVKRVGFRLHPVVVKGGQEWWFLVSHDENILTDAKHKFNDDVTRLKSFRRLTTSEFINSYSKLFNEIWKIRIDSQTRGKGSTIISDALRAGYYDWPRGVSLSKLSKSIDVPRTTLTYRLRKLEKTIFQDIEDTELK